MDLETRVTNLENFINGFAERVGKDSFYTSSDITGIRNDDKMQSQMISDNSEAIFDLAELIESLDERVTALEGGSNG